MMIQMFQKKISNVLFLAIFINFFSTCLLGTSNFFTGFLSGACVGLINMFLLVSVLPEKKVNINFLANFFQKFFLRISSMVILFFGFLVLCKVNILSFFMGFLIVFITVTFIMSKSLLICVKE